jgi:hypothetical protein
LAADDLLIAIKMDPSESDMSIAIMKKPPIVFHK